MRKKIVTVVAAGALGLSGVALAAPALAVVGADSAAATVTSRVDRITEALSGLVTDGTLTQEQADRVASTLDQSDALRGGRGHGGPGGGRDLSAAATALGVTQDELRAALREGRTLAQVAEDEGVAVDTLVQALAEAARARIAQAVTDGRLTQAQADERLADLTARITERVTSSRPERGGRHGGPGRSAPDPAPDSSEAPTPAPSAEGSSATVPSGYATT